MKSMNVTVIIIVFAILLAGCGYTLWHVWQILPFATWGKWLIVVLLAGTIGLIFANGSGYIDSRPMPMAICLYEIGWSSLFILLYGVMLFIVYDLLRLCHVVQYSFLHDSWIGTITTFMVLFCIFLYGNFHYMDKKLVEIDMPTNKFLHKDHKIMMLSDLHIGYHNRVSEVRKWVDLINQQNPEVILIGGDIIDGSVRAIRDQDFISEFKRLKAPIYACLGNHEYNSGETNAKDFYKQAGIHLLIDQSIKVPLEDNDTIVIIGRDDRTNKHRASIETLVRQAPKGDYTILLDHQPYKLEEAEKNKIDFQLSGHTHYGQVWPISWIEDAIYEDAYGPLQKGETQYYVSSGIGIWGGKFRIGTQSEYILATLKSKI